MMGSDGMWDAVEGIEGVNFVEKYRKQCLKPVKRASTTNHVVNKENTAIAQFACEYARRNWL